MTRVAYPIVKIIRLMKSMEASVDRGLIAVRGRPTQPEFSSSYS